MLLPKPAPKPFEALNQEVIPDTSLGLLEKQQLAKDEAIRKWLSDKPIVGVTTEVEESAEEGASRFCRCVSYALRCPQIQNFALLSYLSVSSLRS
jgi:hypothetical protein